MAIDQSGKGDPAAQPAESRTTTIVGLFEDPLDLREALDALRKQGDPAQVSIIIRDQLVDEASAAERHGAVARAADAADIGRSATWLTRLTSIIVPERGGFLVAGPIGLMLTGKPDGPSGDDAGSTSALETVLRGFGLDDEETTYIEQRLVAGAMLTGVTSDVDEACIAAQTLFSEGNAVYLAGGVATASTRDALEALHESVPPILAGGDVVVTDTVGDLYPICGLDGVGGTLATLCGRAVIDRDGEAAGTVDEVIVESLGPPDEASEALTPRYVVIGFGGVLGLGRRRVAIPATQVEDEGDVVRLGVDRATLDRAPSWDANAPFSRREEHLVCAYFGTPPYWTAED